MENSKHKFHLFQSARIQVAGILLLIFLAALMLWFNNINSLQAISAISAKVQFYGEYRIGDSQWQEIAAGQHIPARPKGFVGVMLQANLANLTK